MSRKSQQIAICATVFSALILSGCGSLRLYSEIRDKQGVAAKAAWKEVDLKTIIETERSNLNGLLQAELDTQDRLAAGIRNHALRAMIDADNLEAALVKPLDRQIVRLIGSRDKLQQWSKAGEAKRAAELAVPASAPIFERMNVRMPSCAGLAEDATPPPITKWLSSANASDRLLMDVALGEVRKNCNDIAKAEVAASASLDGDARLAWAQYVRDAGQLAARRREAASLQAQYLAAVTEYDKAIAATQSDPGAGTAVREAAATLGNVLALFRATQSAFAASFISEKRLESIDKLIVAITEATPDGKIPAGADKATVAFLLIPKLIDDARQSLADAKKPLAIPLLIQRNYEQLNLEAANRDIASQETTVRLSREIFEALMQQARQLSTAYNELHENGKDADGKANGKPDITQHYALKVLDAFSKPPAREKELLYSAAARYLDALNRLEAKRYKLEYQRIAAIHERSLAYAEVNMQQWQSLIGITVDQVADYSARGIKPEIFGNLINTLGVLWIGLGVNK